MLGSLVPRRYNGLSDRATVETIARLHLLCPQRRQRMIVGDNVLYPSQLGLATGEVFWGYSPEMTNRHNGFVNTAPSGKSKGVRQQVAIGSAAAHSQTSDERVRQQSVTAIFANFSKRSYLTEFPLEGSSFFNASSMYRATSPHPLNCGRRSEISGIADLAKYPKEPRAPKPFLNTPYSSHS